MTLRVSVRCNAKRGDTMIKTGLRRTWAMAIAIGFVALGFGFATDAQAGPTLDKVKQAGSLTCGVQTGTPGFGQPDSQGKYTGFNIDICRAISAALFGDPDKVKTRILSRRTSTLNSF